MWLTKHVLGIAGAASGFFFGGGGMSSLVSARKSRTSHAGCACKDISHVVSNIFNVLLLVISQPEEISVTRVLLGNVGITNSSGTLYRFFLTISKPIRLSGKSALFIKYVFDLTQQLLFQTFRDELR
jgi:hypothetical protein